MDLVDLSNWDNGLVRVIREIMLIGTEEVLEKNLIEKGYTTKGLMNLMRMKNYQVYSVCYMKEKEQDFYKLFAIARINK